MKSGKYVCMFLCACAAATVLLSPPALAQTSAGGKVVSPAGFPRISYVTPNASSGAGGDFHFGYHHDDDADLFYHLQFLFVAVNRDDPNALFVSVEPESGQVLVGIHGRFGGPFLYGRLGEERTISNTYVNIDLSRASVVRLNDNDYEVRMNLNFITSVWSNQQLNIIMFADDHQFQASEYGQLGTYRIDKPNGNHSPENLSVHPRNDSGRTETFRFAVKDEDGADDIEYIEVTFGHDGAPWWSTLYLGVYPATNRYRLYAFGDTREGTIGVSDLENDWVHVLSSTLAKGREDKYYYFTTRLKFSPRFIGEYNVYLYTRDRTHREDGDRMTRYTVTRSTHTPVGLFLLPADPVVSSMDSPGLPIPVYFYGVWSDLDGTDDIARLEVKIAENAGDTSNVALIRIKPNDNIVDIRANDVDADNLPTPIGSATSLDVSTLQLPADQVSLRTLGRTQFAVNFSAYFKDTIRGQKNIYMRATDFSGNRGPWRRVETIQIAGGNAVPRPLSVTPVWSDGTRGRLSLKFRDVDGANDIEYAEVIINSGENAVAEGGIRLVYNNRTRILTVQQDGGSASGSIDNPNLDLGFSRAVVDFGRSWVFHEGQNLNLYLTITFDPEVFGGVKTIWLKCTDTRGRTSRWRALAGFYIR